MFKIYPDVCYPWVGKETPVTLASASMFQAGDRNVMMIGGGDGCALQVNIHFYSHLTIRVWLGLAVRYFSITPS